jgi:hypothetical protein
MHTGRRADAGQPLMWNEGSELFVSSFWGRLLLVFDDHHMCIRESQLACLRRVALWLLYPLNVRFHLRDLSSHSLLPVIELPLNVRFTLAEDHLRIFAIADLEPCPVSLLSLDKCLDTKSQAQSGMNRLIR